MPPSGRIKKKFIDLIAKIKRFTKALVNISKH